MLTVIIATHDSERALVGTLCALVPGATMGLVREVIVADAGSKDETEQVADIAGCRFLSSAEPLGVRLKAAAQTARGTWLMFLPAGIVPDPGWIDETMAFVEQTERAGKPSAAVFTPGKRDLMTLVRRAFGLLPRPGQGLILAKSFYDELRGHPAIAGAQAALLRGIGRRRLTTLRTAAHVHDI